MVQSYNSHCCRPPDLDSPRLGRVESNVVPGPTVGPPHAGASFVLSMACADVSLEEFPWDSLAVGGLIEMVRKGMKKIRVAKGGVLFIGAYSNQHFWGESF